MRLRTAGRPAAHAPAHTSCTEDVSPPQQTWTATGGALLPSSQHMQQPQEGRGRAHIGQEDECGLLVGVQHAVRGEAGVHRARSAQAAAAAGARPQPPHQRHLAPQSRFLALHGEHWCWDSATQTLIETHVTVSLPTCVFTCVQTARMAPLERRVEYAAHIFCVRAAARARHSLPWGTDPWEARARTADDASPAVMKNAMNWSGPSTCACAVPEHLVYILLNISGPHHLVHIP